VSGPWEVHLSPEAAAVLRDVSRSAATSIAAVLNDLAEGGSARVDAEHDGQEWTGRAIAGDYIVTVGGREGDQRLIVVRIALANEPRAQRAVEMIPLPQRTRRRIGTLLHGVDLDLRYTLRALRRTPLFAAVVIGTLSLGFGGATALLDIANSVYASALPFANGDRLVRVRNANTSTSGDIRRYNLLATDFEMLRSQNRSFTDVVAMSGRSMSLVGDGLAERVSAVGVSPRWTGTLGIRPLLGRTFTPDEESAGSDAGVALISHSLWQRRFGGDAGVVGSTFRHEEGVLTIVGILQPSFNYPYDADVWTPWTFSPATGSSSSLNVVARLATAATLESARLDAARMHADRKAANLAQSATSFDVATVRNDFIRDEARTVNALSAAVCVLLLLACVNVANLLTARFTTRRAELGLRAALGGRRDQQVRQMMLESLLLFAAGTAGGVLVGSWLQKALTVIVPDTLRTQLGIGSDGVGLPIIALTVAAGLACGAAIGIIAAFRAVGADTASIVRQGGRNGMNGGDRRLFDVLVASQLSFSLVLLVGASLLIGRFRELASADPGYTIDGVQTMRITIDNDRYRNAAARLQLVRTIEERVAAVPGIESVGITTVNPLCCGDWGASIAVEGRVIQPNDPPVLVAHSYVSPGYFGTMGMRLLRGHGFDESEHPNSPLHVVIDEAFARMAWPGEDAIGKRVRRAREGSPWLTVVGIVPVTKHEAEMTASWFLPYNQDPVGPSTEHLHVMTTSSTVVPVQALREVIARIDPALAVYGTTTMRALSTETTSQDRLGAIISGVFAAFGLILAGFSLYGLLSYSVELRSAEMGLRMALGATRRSIVGLVLQQAARRLLTGTACGVVLAFAVNQLLRSAVDGLPWVPWQTLVALTSLMAAVAIVAATFPALRATRVDPMRSLRA
jgi:putative ABC transport system permease protein